MTKDELALEIAINETLNEWRGSGWYLTVYDNNSLTYELEWYESATEVTYALCDAAYVASDPNSTMLVYMGDGAQPQGY